VLCFGVAFKVGVRNADLFSLNEFCGKCGVQVFDRGFYNGACCAEGEEPAQQLQVTPILGKGLIQVVLELLHYKADFWKALLQYLQM
jgi:hypothetical protein